MYYMWRMQYCNLVTGTIPIPLLPCNVKSELEEDSHDTVCRVVIDMQGPGVIHLWYLVLSSTTLFTFL